MTLNNFVQESQHCLNCFEQWWKEMHELNPEEFPLSFEEDNNGMWWEALEGYEITDEVYSLTESV